MKKYDSIFLVLGALLSLLPMYNFWGWIYIWNSNPTLTPTEKCTVFNSDILFNLFEGRYTAALAFFIPGFIAGILLLLSLLNSIQFGAKQKFIKLIFFILNLLFTFWILWGLM
jgi:hypothetical protein